MTARNITAQGMRELAWALLSCNDLYRGQNPGVCWTCDVDRYRRRVVIRANGLVVLDLSRHDLFLSARYQGIAC